MTVEEVHAEGLHGAGAVAAQRTRLHQIVLAHVFVLEMRTHRNLTLEAAIADRTVVRQRLCVRGEVLGQVVLPKESLLTDAAFVGLHAGVPLLVSTHVGAIRKLHLKRGN